MSRRGYVFALVAAVLILLGSLVVTALAMAGHRQDCRIVRGTGIYGEGGCGPGGSWGPGMMRPGDGTQGEIPQAEAERIASDWLRTNQPGAQLGVGVSMPMGAVFPVIRDGVTVGTLVVSDRKGKVRYEELRPAGPAPTPSGST